MIWFRRTRVKSSLFRRLKEPLPEVVSKVVRDYNFDVDKATGKSIVVVRLQRENS